VPHVGTGKVKASTTETHDFGLYSKSFQQYFTIRSWISTVEHVNYTGYLSPRHLHSRQLDMDSSQRNGAALRCK
jgi:hypothetical protein